MLKWTKVDEINIVLFAFTFSFSKGPSCMGRLFCFCEKRGAVMYADPNSVQYRHKDGKRYVSCSITATDTPSPMPSTGEDVVNLDAEDVLDMGTTLLVTNGGDVYMMDENLVFQPVG